MARVTAKFIRFGTGTDEVNSRVLPAYFTPTNYTPAQVASEGNDKTSAHLNGIDLALGTISGGQPDIRFIANGYLRSATTVDGFYWAKQSFTFAKLGVTLKDEGTGDTIFALKKNGSTLNTFTHTGTGSGKWKGVYMYSFSFVEGDDISVDVTSAGVGSQGLTVQPYGSSAAGQLPDARFLANGALRTATTIDSFYYVRGTYTFSKVGITIQEQGSAGNTVLQINKNGSSQGTVTIPSGGGKYKNLFTSAINFAVAEGDDVSVDITSVATGASGLDVQLY